MSSPQEKLPDWLERKRRRNIRVTLIQVWALIFLMTILVIIFIWGNTPH